MLGCAQAKETDMIRQSVLCDVRTEAEETVELVACNTTEHSQMAAI